MRVGGVYRPWRPHVDHDLAAFCGMQQVLGSRHQIARHAAVVETEIIQRPVLSVLQDAWIAGESRIGAARRSVAQNGIALVSLPTLQIGRHRNARLFVPALLPDSWRCRRGSRLHRTSPGKAYTGRRVPIRRRPRPAGRDRRVPSGPCPCSGTRPITAAPCSYPELG